jgi:hypothetical protein
VLLSAISASLVQPAQAARRGVGRHHTKDTGTACEYDHQHATILYCSHHSCQPLIRPHLRTDDAAPWIRDGLFDLRRRHGMAGDFLQVPVVPLELHRPPTRRLSCLSAAISPKINVRPPAFGRVATPGWL